MSSNDRKLLIRLLGNKCHNCNESDKSVLHIDHILGHGYLEKEYFKTKVEMYRWYIENFDFEFDYLQVLCFNCNIKKRIKNKETRNRLSLRDCELMKTPYTPDRLDELMDFLDSHVQFLPIISRLIYNQKKLIFS